VFQADAHAYRGWGIVSRFLISVRSGLEQKKRMGGCRNFTLEGGSTAGLPKYQLVSSPASKRYRERRGGGGAVSHNKDTRTHLPVL